MFGYRKFVDYHVNESKKKYRRRKNLENLTNE